MRDLDIDSKRVLGWSCVIVSVLCVIICVVFGLIAVWSNDEDLADKAGQTCMGALVALFLFGCAAAMALED